MPRVKIDYVVSFSSEDSENPAANLLSSEVGRGRWLCARGEPVASVVLQLERACTISSVTIGAHQAALVEVLVGRSETPSEPYQVLVPSSVFLGPRESRGGAGAGAGGERVRTFARAALAERTRDQRWDRVRLVATQPYNKHCKYGLAFVHLFEPERAPRALSEEEEEESLRPGQMFALPEEEEESFRPGELFALHRRAAPAPAPALDTGALIRGASAAVRASEAGAGGGAAAPLARAGSSERRDSSGETPSTSEQRPTPLESDRSAVGDTRGTPERYRSAVGDTRGTPRHDAGRTGRDDNMKRPRSHRKDVERGAEGARPLEGVVFVLSGYENPRRGRLRELAVALGARPQRDWGPACTHLICAFPNTPKMRDVVARGRGVPVVRAEWLEACARAGRRLPWRAHATDPALRDRAPSPPSPPPPHPSECDTDDEIEEALRQQKRRRTAASPRAASGLGDEGVQASCAGGAVRRQGDVAADSEEGDTEPEPEEEAAGGGGELPALLEGLAFLVTERSAAPLQARLLARYARAYGAHLLTPDEAHARDDPYYVLCGSRGAGGGEEGGGGGTRLRADWLWACHEARALLPADEYLLPGDALR